MVDVLGNQPVALPEKLGGFAVHVFGDASAKGVVAVGDVAAVGQGDADQAVLAVVAVMAHQSLAGAASFADEVAVGVVVEVAITLHQQAVAFDFAVAAALAVVALAEQVARRVVGEVFDVVDEADDFGEAVEGVVGVAVLTFAAVGEQAQVAVGVVLVAAPVVVVAGDFAVVVERVDAVFLEAVLFVVVVFAEHRALLTHDFAPVFKAVAGEALAVEVDGFEHAAGVVEVVQAVAVGQFAVAELAEGVVAVAQGGPALMLGDEAVLQVVFVGQRPLAVVDGGEAAEAVVGVGDFTAVGQGFDQQASGTVALVGVFQRLGVGVFGFFQQVVGLFVAGDALTFGGVLAVKVVKPQCRDIWLRRPAASHL